MTVVVFSAQAEADIDRLTDFLAETDVLAATAIADIILDAARILVRHPGIGRRTRRGQRELVISRGRSGYVALYREDVARDRVEILAIRHQRESGYGASKGP